METQEKLLLTPAEFKPNLPDWKIEGIFNPGVIRRKDGKIVLYVRVAERFVSDDFLAYPIALPGKKFTFKIERVNSEDFLKQAGNMLLLKNHTYRLSNISHFRKVVLNKNGFDVEKIESELFPGIKIHSTYSKLSS